MPVRPWLLGLACLGLAAAAHGQMQATTDDGERVLLREDGTWSYLSAQDGAGPEGAGAEPRIRILLQDAKDIPGECRVGVRLENQSDYEIRSLVPQFSAHNSAGVRLSKVFKDFTRVKPSQDQYQELSFRGITCEDVDYVRVHGGDRCTMDDLTKFSRVRGECLRRVGVRSQGPIRMTK